MAEIGTRPNQDDEVKPQATKKKKAPGTSADVDADVQPDEAEVGSGSIDLDAERRLARGLVQPQPVPDPAVLGPNQPVATVLQDPVQVQPAAAQPVVGQPLQGRPVASTPAAEVTVSASTSTSVQPAPEPERPAPRQLSPEQQQRLNALNELEQSWAGRFMKWVCGDDYFAKQRLEIMVGREKAREVMAAIEKGADARARKDAVLGGTRDPNLEGIIADLEKDGALTPEMREQLKGTLSAIDKDIYDRQHAHVQRQLEIAESLYGDKSLMGRWMGDYGKQQLAETRMRLLLGDEKAQQMIAGVREEAANRARTDFDAGRMRSDANLGQVMEGLDPEIAQALRNDLRAIDKTAYKAAMNDVVREKLGDEVANIRAEAEALELDQKIDPEARDRKIEQALERLKEKNPNLTEEQLKAMGDELKSQYNSAYDAQQEKLYDDLPWYKKLGRAVSSAIDSVVETVRSVGETLLEVGSTVLGGIGSALSWVGEVTGISNVVSGVYNMAVGVYEGVTTGSWERLEKGWDQFKTGVTTYASNLWEATKAVGGFLYDVGDALGINDMVSGLYNIGAGIVTGDLGRIGKGFCQLGSGAVRLAWECTGLADAYRAVTCLGSFLYKGLTGQGWDTGLLVEGLVSLGAAALSIGSIVATGGAAVAVVGGLRAVGTQVCKKLATQGFKALGKELGEQIVSKCAKVLGKEVVEKASKEAGLKAGKECAEAFGKEAAEYCAKHGLKELPQDVAKEMAERIAREQAQVAAREGTEKMLQEAGVEKIVKEQVLEALEKVSKGNLDDLVKKGAIDKETAKAMQKALNKELCDDALKEALTKEITDKLTKDIVEKGEKAFMEGFMEGMEKSTNKHVQAALKDKVVREGFEKGAREGYEAGVREGVEKVVKKAVDDAFDEHRKKNRRWDLGSGEDNAQAMLFFTGGMVGTGFVHTDLVDRDLMEGNEGPQEQRRKTDEDIDDDNGPQAVSLEERRRDHAEQDLDDDRRGPNQRPV